MCILIYIYIYIYIYVLKPVNSCAEMHRLLTSSTAYLTDREARTARSLSKLGVEGRWADRPATVAGETRADRPPGWLAGSSQRTNRLYMLLLVSSAFAQLVLLHVVYVNTRQRILLAVDLLRWTCAACL